MRVSIYLGPKNGTIINANNINIGNPGVGGTQFCMLQLANYLKLLPNYQVILISTRQYVMEGVENINIESELDLHNVATKCNTDILILNQSINDALKSVLKKVHFKIVVWSHNYILSDLCKFITNTPLITCNVFVGKQQYDRYIDDDVISKSTYIYNMYNDNTPSVCRRNDSKTVVYMGAIVPGKGFAELCKIWPYILKHVPDAKLLVLGSGALYGGDVKLGKLNIAEESYEQTFYKYITDSEGNVLPSVKFLGIVGDNKIEIFRNASVGVVNPSGRTETFGMGIVEMAEAELPVVTIAKNGFYDTIENGVTGILSSSLSQIGKDIVFLLKNKDINEQYGRAAKQKIKRYSPSIIGEQWNQILTAIYINDYKPIQYKYSLPLSNNNKWIRIVIKNMRSIKFLKWIPSLIKVETFAFNIINSFKK